MVRSDTEAPTPDRETAYMVKAEYPTTPTTIRLETAKLETLKEIAWRRRTTTSALIREAIDMLLQEPGGYGDVI